MSDDDGTVVFFESRFPTMEAIKAANPRAEYIRDSAGRVVGVSIPGLGGHCSNEACPNGRTWAVHADRLCFICWFRRNEVPE